MGRNSENQSVATMWGEMVAAAQRGEVVAIANKFGEDVAVMMSKEAWYEIEWSALCHANIDMLIDMPPTWQPGIAWADIDWPD